MAIADKVRDSDRLFHDILEELEVSKTDPAYGIVHSIAVDTWDRFHLWVGNIGADRQAASILSLESRLTSASEALREISNLLGSLIDTLRDLLGILNSQRGNADNMPKQSREDGIDESDTDSEVETRDHRTDYPSAAQAFLGIVSECITGLFRLSTLVIKATPQDRYSKGQEGRDSFSIHNADIQDVTDLFPKLSRTESAWLRERLGRANTKRRNFVEYCREHQVTITEESPNRSGPQGLRFLAISEDIEPTVAKQESISTKASGSNIDLLQEDDDPSESDDTRTLISAAYSTDLEVEQFPQILRLSEVNNGNDTFECPLCCITGRFADESSWQRHLYQDLRIYVCTADEPECSNRLFGDRKAWFDHELQHHRCQWTCIICQEGPFHTASILRDHATTHHAGLEPELVEGLIAASQRPLQVIAASECPFCDEWEQLNQSDQRNKLKNTTGSVLVELKEFQNHVANHLQKVALLSLAKTSEQYTKNDVSSKDEPSSPLSFATTIRDQAATVVAESGEARPTTPVGPTEAAMQEAAIVVHDTRQRQKEPAPGIASFKQRTQSGDDDLRLFHEQVEHCTRISVFRGRHHFVLVQRLRSWMQEPVESHGQTHSSRACALLESVYPGREPYQGAFRDYGKHLVSGNEQSFIDILIILLQIKTATLVLLDRFYKHQVFDSDIPDMLRNPSELGDIVRGSIYYKSHNFDTVVDDFMTFAHRLTASQNIKLLHEQDMPPGMILPFTVQQHIGHGRKSDVFRIEVPAESMPDNLVQRIDDGPTLDTLHASKVNFDEEPLVYELALKRVKHEEDWKREIEFHRVHVGARGIVRCFGSWKISSGGGREYYLLLELGRTNLENYFQTYTAPTVATEILDFWTSFRDIASALKYIHTLRISSAATEKTYFGWHGDIKLSNFLLCPSPNGGTMTHVIKLTDFGLAKLEEAIPGNQMESTTLLHGGTVEYGGPERIDPTTGKIDGNKPVTRTFDVWSLGCIIYEAATWITLGAEGVKQFRLLRKIKDNHAQDLNYEYIGDNAEFHLRAEVASVVNIWHGHLLDAVRNRDCITGRLLEIAKRHMLQTEPSHRASAVELVKLFDEAFAQALAQVYSGALKSSRQPELLQTALRLYHNQSQQNSDARALLSAPLRSNKVHFTRFAKPTNTLSPPEQRTVPELQESYLHSSSRPLTPTGSLKLPLTDNTKLSARPLEHSQTMPGETLTIFRRNVDRPSEEAVDTSQLPSFGYWDAVRFLYGLGWTYTTAIEFPGSTGGEQDSEAQMTGFPGNLHWFRSSIYDDRGQYSPQNSALWQYVESISKAPQGSRDTFRSSSAEPNEQQSSQEAMFGDMFNDRDIIFLFDNRQSMYVHWPQVQAVVGVLMAMLYGQDRDGFDAYFSSHRQRYSLRSDPSKLHEDLASEWPSLEVSYDPSIYSTLKHILDVIRRGITYRRKVTLIIFTDGFWRDQQRQLIESVIEKWLRQGKTRRASDIDPRRYSLQFIHFGNQLKSLESLESMKYDLCKGIDVTDVIDVEPADGNIHKMIMGSLDDTCHRPKTSTTTTRTRIVTRKQRSGIPKPASPLLEIVETQHDDLLFF